MTIILKDNDENQLNDDLLTLAADPLYSLGVGVAHTHVQPVTR